MGEDAIHVPFIARHRMISVFSRKFLPPPPEREGKELNEEEGEYPPPLAGGRTPDVRLGAPGEMREASPSFDGAVVVVEVFIGTGDSNI